MITDTIILPPVLTPEQFAYLVQLKTDTVRRKIRARNIVGKGNPIRIPVRELLKFGVNLDDAARALHYRDRALMPHQEAEA
jgi:hypothetical protein